MKLFWRDKRQNRINSKPRKILIAISENSLGKSEKASQYTKVQLILINTGGEKLNKK